MTTDEQIPLPDCPEFCTEFCRHMMPGPHVAESIIIGKGGPMADPEAKVGTVDLTPSISVHKLGGHPAEVVIAPQVWIKDRWNWTVPGETSGMLPEIKMSPERAMYLADVLRETALTAFGIDGRVMPA